MTRSAPDRDGLSPNEQAGLWCARFAAGTLSPEHQALFDRWIEESDANRAAFDAALAVWQDLHPAGATPEVVALRADALDALRRANRRRWARPSFPSWRMPLAAAAGVLAILAGVALLPNATTSYETGVGERRTVLLEDGSRLSLDAQTKVRVDYRPKRRALTLFAGRAKFDVRKDASRPFTVTAADRTVIATGTAFSVELLGPEMHVILYGGHVEVVDDDPRMIDLPAPGRGRNALLAPGQEFVAEVGRPVAQLVQTDVARSLAWEAGQMNFTDETLASAVERLNRYTNDKIVILDAPTGAIQINGVFNAGDSAAFVEAVTTAYPVRARRERGVILLSASNAEELTSRQ